MCRYVGYKAPVKALMLIKLGWSVSTYCIAKEAIPMEGEGVGSREECTPPCRVGKGVGCGEGRGVGAGVG